MSTSPDGSFSGGRSFAWYRPASGYPSDYEDQTVHVQQSPEHFAVQGWPIRFDDGRAPITAASTLARSSDWYAFRDPDALVSRRYFADLAEDERALARALDATPIADRLARVPAAWLSRGLSAHLSAYPFYEHGLFVSLCYAEREALSDTLTFATVFSAADRLRALQDVARFSLELEALPGYRDLGRPTWLEDPAWQGMRRATERVLAIRDWVEVLVGGLLVLDIIAGDVLRFGLFDAAACSASDGLTPRVLSATLADVARGRRWVGKLVDLLIDDPVHGPHNLALLRDIRARWEPDALAAAIGLRGAFEQSGAAGFHAGALATARARLDSAWARVNSAGLGAR